MVSPQNRDLSGLNNDNREAQREKSYTQREQFQNYNQQPQYNNYSQQNSQQTQQLPNYLPQGSQVRNQSQYARDQSQQGQIYYPENNPDIFQCPECEQIVLIVNIQLHMCECLKECPHCHQQYSLYIMDGHKQICELQQNGQQISFSERVYKQQQYQNQCVQQAQWQAGIARERQIQIRAQLESIQHREQHQNRQVQDQQRVNQETQRSEQYRQQDIQSRNSSLDRFVQQEQDNNINNQTYSNVNNNSFNISPINLTQLRQTEDPLSSVSRNYTSRQSNRNNSINVQQQQLDIQSNGNLNRSQRLQSIGSITTIDQHRNLRNLNNSNSNSDNSVHNQLLNSEHNQRLQSEESTNSNEGLSQQEINSFQISKFQITNKKDHNQYSQYNQQNVNQCCICICEFEEGEDTKFLDCYHRFHAHCINTWLEMNHICPVCKLDLRPQQIDEFFDSYFEEN